MFKRFFDISMSLSFLIVLFPFFCIIFFCSKIFIGGNVFFKQKRPGLNGEIFEMIKFRSMTDEVNEKGELLPDSERLTSFGRFLRVTSLDELPELWNVLKGDMSIVGPRPLLVAYLPLYDQEQARRHEVKPGITGWAQVNGRNLTAWDERLQMDVWYVDNRSFFLDIKIIIKTVMVVLSRKGVSSNNSETMESFKGGN